MARYVTVREIQLNLNDYDPIVFTLQEACQSRRVRDKSKPTELSQDDIEAAKKEWENIVLSEGEDNI